MSDGDFVVELHRALYGCAPNAVWWMAWYDMNVEQRIIELRKMTVALGKTQSDLNQETK